MFKAFKYFRCKNATEKGNISTLNTWLTEMFKAFKCFRCKNAMEKGNISTLNCFFFSTLNSWLTETATDEGVRARDRYTLAFGHSF